MLILTDSLTCRRALRVQSLSYVDLKGNTYKREVGALLNNITYDRESGSLADGHSPFQSPFQAPIAKAAPEQMAFRLPGARSH